MRVETVSRQDFQMPGKRIDIDGSEVQMRQAENWTVWAKKADFQEIGKKYGIDQVEQPGSCVTGILLPMRRSTII